MNYISFAIIGITVITIVAGVLLGLLRGWKRSLLRLGLILLSVILAFSLCGVVANGIFNMNIAKFIPDAGAETLTVSELVSQTVLGELPEGVTDLALVLAKSLIKVIMFLLLFGLFQLFTWAVVFPICKIFVKPRKFPGKKGESMKKGDRLIGMGIGFAQGLVVCLCVCVVLTGILVQANNIIVMANDLSSLTSDLEAMPLSDDGYEFVIDESGANDSETGMGELDAFGEMISEYTESSFGKMYDKIGAQFFDKLSEVENANGDKVTLSGQLNAIRGVVDLAKELIRFKDIDFNHMLQSGNVENIKDIFNALQHINESLSKESKETIKNVLESVAEEMDLPIDLSGLDFDEIDFSKEGEIFTELLDYNDKEEITPEDAKDIVEKIAESDLVLELLADQDNINLSQQLEQGPHRDAIEESIKEMEEKGEIEQSKIDALKKIFGIGSGNNSETETPDME